MSAERRRPPIVGRYTREELALVTRNSGMPLEALRHEVTPVGLHYLLVHFDIPSADEALWRLEVSGLVERPLALTLADVRGMKATTLRVTMECAGNGRGQMTPRYPSMPWIEEGVSTAEWTGVRLADLLSAAGLKPQAVDLVFHGADRGIDRGIEHAYARSLTPAQAQHEEVLIAYRMNGEALPPQHGFPLRLVVPRWYGMASVKWLTGIEAIGQRFEGVQQTLSYHFRSASGAKGTPCTRMRVNSLMVPPGIPDFYTRVRSVQAGPVLLMGRAWSGEAPIAKVEFAADGAWCEAMLDPPQHDYAWQGWRAQWQATPGAHELACRATDRSGNTQPLEPLWDATGFGNNAVQRVPVVVP